MPNIEPHTGNKVKKESLVPGSNKPYCRVRQRGKRTNKNLTTTPTVL